MAAPINDWLVKTVEPALEPDLPICDPHHHLWDGAARTGLSRAIFLDELEADTGSGPQTSYPPCSSRHGPCIAPTRPWELRPVGEVEFVQGIAAQSASGMYSRTKAAHGIVGHANLHLGAEVRRVLEALQAASPNRFKGIRHGVSWDPNPEIPIVGAYPMPDQLLSDDYRARRAGTGRHGPVAGRVAVAPAAAAAGGLCQRRARPDHRAEPRGRADAHRAIRRQPRRGDGELAQRHRGGGPVP